jgi:steroid delta-isomerase-like uncharacterized protein
MLRRHFLMTVAAAALTLGVASQTSLAADSADAVVQAYVAAWNAHDSAKAAGFFADNVVYYDASVGKPIEGRDAAKTGVIDNFLTAVPDAVWTMKGEPVVQGDRVAFEWEFAGNNTGPWGDGTAATGKHFSFTGASVFSIEDGKIVAQSDYYDALGFYKQLGLM